jgi:AcrR family transcriptional regulator
MSKSWQGANRLREINAKGIWMGRREEKREVTRQDILTAASTLFATLGYEQTSVDDIAEKANLSKGTFYYHFPAKVDVVKALQRASLAQTSKKADAMLEQHVSAKHILKELLKERAAWMESNKELARVIVMERFARLSANQQNKETPPLRLILTRVVQAGQASNELKSHVSPEEIAKLLAAVLVQGVSTSIREDWQTSFVDRLDTWLDLLLSGIEV